MSSRYLSSLLALLIAATSLVVVLMPSPGNSDEGALRTRWKHDGFGEAFSMRATDLDGDGNDELIYGGRGVGAIDLQSMLTGRPRWSFKWDDPVSVLQGGDNDWATFIEPIDANGDGTRDLLISSVPRNLNLIDGSNGARIWHTELNGHVDLGAIAIDADDDGISDLFPNGNRVAISGATGEVLWEADTDTLPKPANKVASGELDDVPGRDIVVSTTLSGVGGDNFHALSSSGELLYRTATISQVTSVAAADIDGDGIDEAIAGTFNGTVWAMGEEGVLWTAAPGPDIDGIEALAVSDVNDDGREDILAGTVVRGADSHQVVALSGVGGAQLWRQPVDEKVFELSATNLDADPSDELLVGTGDRFDDRGVALALETGVTEPVREKWRVETHEYIRSLDVATWGGQRVAFIGSEDSILRAVDATNGVEVWRWATGYFVSSVAAGDLNGDGLDEFVSGDYKGNIIVTDVNGDRLWSARADVSNLGETTAVATGDGDGDGRDEVAYGGMRFNGDKPGVVELYRPHGVLRWSRLFDGTVADVAMGDLDGDGAEEVVIAELGAGTTIRAIDPATGIDVWSTPLVGPTADMASIDVDDIDGDGNDEIAYSDIPTLFGGGRPHTALLNSAGEVQWIHNEFGRPNYWVDIVSGAVIHGGGDFDGNGSTPGGHITRRAETDGAIEWQRIIPFESDYGSVSRFATSVPDVTGDGRDEHAVSTDSGIVHLLDGMDGSDLWTQRLEPEGLEFTQRHQAGPLVYVDPGAGTPYIVAAQYSTRRPRSKTAALGLDGAYLGAIPMEGRSTDATVARFAPDLVGAVVGGGLGLYAVDSCMGCPTRTEPSPAPTTSSSPTPTPSGSGPGHDSYRAEGEIKAFNPESITAPGVTETEFATRCETPATQGFDGYVFTLPDQVTAGARFTASGSNDMDLYDLNVYFYDDDCTFMDGDYVATEAFDEEGRIPSAARHAVVNNVIGIATAVVFEAALSEGSPSPTASASTSPSATPSPSSSPGGSPSRMTFTDNSEESGQFSDQATFEAELVDATTGAPLAGRTVTFTLGTDGGREFTTTTNELGVATVTRRLEEKPGNYQLTARFAGDEGHDGSADTRVFIVDREDTTTELVIEGKGSKRSLAARLTDADSNDPISDRSISFLVDDDAIGTDQTDIDGWAQAELEPRHRGGHHTYRARFDGDDYYLHSQGEQTT